MSRLFGDILDPLQEQVVVDIETLSTETDAVIVAIGATKFTIEEGIIDKFLVNVDPIDSKKYGLDIDPYTVDWWKRQPGEVSDLWKINPQPLEKAMSKFADWFGIGSLPIWGNSPSFDCVILKSNFMAVKVPPPWKFRDECCYRTLAKLMKYKAPDSNMHSALDDAVWETENLIKLLRS